MTDATVIIISSSSPPPPPSQPLPLPNAERRTISPKEEIAKRPVVAIETPTKNRDVWSIPSSSCSLPSPGEMLRSLMHQKGISSNTGTIGRGFTTASEILREERDGGKMQGGPKPKGQHMDPFASSDSKCISKDQQCGSAGTMQRMKISRNTTSKPKTAVKRTTTVSGHFPKRSKTASTSCNSKSSSEEACRREESVAERKKIWALAASGTSKAEELPGIVSEELRENIQPLAKNMEGTTGKKIYTVPVVEIVSSSPSREQISPLPTPTPQFRSRLGVFNYKNSTTASIFGINQVDAGVAGSGLGTTKRSVQVLERAKRARLVSTLAKPIISKKTKTSRRRVQTITGAATAQYRIDAVESSVNADSTTQNVFSEIDTVTGCLEPADTVKPKGSKVTKRTRGTANPQSAKRKRAAKVTEAIDEHTELLSPQSAMKKVKDQPMIFGSLSQLTEGQGKFPSLKGTTSNGLPGPILQKLSRKSRFRGLAMVRAADTQENNDVDEEFEALEKYLEDEPQVDEKLALKKSRKASLWAEAAQGSYIDMNGMNFVDLSRTPKRCSRSPKSKRGHSPAKDCDMPLPLPTFSSSGMGQDVQEVVHQTPKSTRTRKVKGKPSENTSEDITSSPSRTRKSNRSGSAQLSSPMKRRKRRSSKPSRITHLVYRDTQKNEAMQTSISQAIMAQYSSTENISNSWHYKILLYEPIILEDLTVWLNTEGLSKVGVDEEVPPEVVKEWAERRSICNVWEKGNRGQERKRL
ncbi:hypothetical protein BDZ91DRAFT_732546 [Kalaharituber pfeilii]|nr:hypothetical protein BDZ91DRAFT_732546 [Kalaharituber pfeilii]